MTGSSFAGKKPDVKYKQLANRLNKNEAGPKALQTAGKQTEQKV